MAADRADSDRVEILLIRHAEALDGGASLDDAHRPLTDRGRKKARKLGKQLRLLHVRLDVIVFSPLVRAVQTAELVGVGMHHEAGLDVAPELTPRRAPSLVINEVLIPRAELESVALVGHEPQLGDLLRRLLKCDAPSPSKCSAILLSWDGPDTPAKLRWALKPGMDQPSPTLAIFE